jgi:predicted nucleotidyltransferase
MRVNTVKVNETLRSYRVEIAYLFGSQARGEARPLSDADVGVLFEESVEPQARFHAMVMLTSELPSVMGISRVDVVDLLDARHSRRQADPKHERCPPHCLRV